MHGSSKETAEEVVCACMHINVLQQSLKDASTNCRDTEENSSGLTQ